VHPIGRAKRYYMVFIYCAVASLLSADQNLMAPNLTCVLRGPISNLGSHRPTTIGDVHVDMQRCFVLHDADARDLL